MVNKRKEETMTNKLDNNQFEYKDKDQIKSFILKMDYERKYKYCFVSPQEVLEDLIEKAREDISTAEMIYEYRGRLHKAKYEAEKNMLQKQLTHLLDVYEDINKGELEYDIAKEGSE